MLVYFWKFAFITDVQFGTVLEFWNSSGPTSIGVLLENVLRLTIELTDQMTKSYPSKNSGGSLFLCHLLPGTRLIHLLSWGAPEC